MASDPMGLSGGFGARAAGQSLEDIVRQQILQQEMRLRIAQEEMQKQQFQAQLAQRQAEQGEQSRQFGMGHGLNVRQQGHVENVYAGGAGQRAADLKQTETETEGKGLVNQRIVRGNAAADALRADPRLGQAIQASEAGLPPTSPEDLRRAYVGG